MRFAILNRCSSNACKLSRGFALALVLGITGIHALPQSSLPGKPVIFGFITDSSGADVPKAAISLEGPDGTILHTTADQNGQFTIEAPSGDYILKASSPGFSIYKESIRLTDVTSMKRNIVLTLFNCTACVEVTPLPRPIELLDASLTSTLPLNPLPPLKLHKRLARPSRLYP
ncbi:carboxypeptidase-like regulatory domain-containing protein [Edaphobacter bradus]|uniref:carboxypeptidase-like regulatory domain-containing protein n=1 Tax=Edaphobacter bradus TaxID=2259016 RepID=UPI0037BFCB25